MAYVVCFPLEVGHGELLVSKARHQGLSQVLKKLVDDGEQILDEVAKELWDKEVFHCWLNVDHGLEGIGFEDWERLGDVRTHTQKYLEKFDVAQKVSRLAQVLNQRTGTI
jgi:alanine racemase